MRLLDMGERRVVSDLVERYLGAQGSRIEVGVGDDAAVMGPFDSAERIVVTVDACPTPVVDLLGIGSWRDWGRLAAVISLSDIAAMGASPTALLCATAMPQDMLASEYEDFLGGLDEVCQDFATPIIGGNVREASSFSATTVGLGTCKRPWLRSGAAAGDALIVVGAAGLFWSATLDVLARQGRTQLTPAQQSTLFDPRPKLDAVRILMEAGVEVRAAIDCSDGLGAGVNELCRQSDTGAIIEYAGFPVPAEVIDSARDWSIPLERLLLAWGDWQLLLALPEEEHKGVLALLRDHGCESFKLGMVAAGHDVLETWDGSAEAKVRTDFVASLRFESESYLIGGLYGYANKLRDQ